MSRSTEGPTLSEYGEFRAIRDILLPLGVKSDAVTAVGDDCAYVALGDQWLAVSADVGPRPLIDLVPGRERNFEAGGWLAAVATISDLATAGAEPLLLTNCIDAPADLPIADLEAFMRGYFKACAAFGFKNGGGDLRQGRELIARVFGVGAVRQGPRIGRGGARAGDRIVAIGPTGQVMATYLNAIARSAAEPLSPEAAAILSYPTPQMREMAALVGRNLVHAASDKSDGLLVAVENIAGISELIYHLKLQSDFLDPATLLAAQRSGAASPWNIFFSWGDWSVAAAIPIARWSTFEAACAEAHINYRCIGQFTDEAGSLVTVDDAATHAINVVRNENFTDKGYNGGVEAHIRYMMETPIFGALVPVS